MNKVLVIEATGILGKLVCQEILRQLDRSQLVVADYQIERGKQLAQSLSNQTEFCYVDITKRDSIEAAICQVNVVIVALKQKEPAVQKLCIGRGVHCIDVTPFSSFTSQVEQLHNYALEKRVCSITMSGFFPGLSALMVKKAVKQFDEVSNVDVALLQHTNAKAGITGIMDMLQIISEPVTKENQLTYTGFTRRKKLPFGDCQTLRFVREIHHDEKEFVAEKLGLDSIHYWTAWNNDSFNHLLFIL
ncbi:saccharopine dehydrogenase NADP-binding domain-containing protein [Halalkalibacter sp. AB-rgal2]|uniref:saccharopine dehydrogenase NADP-binding domain-containing protein n=1 Tax=Halalkalibacter sp. AB-rgal2 TaxID=3242695 RepID=UPI00359DD66A